ncbi:DUF1120 domain-containing protein [Pseudomonas sp. C1C7]|uniref:DUF1120 domain-containing protein n=1 Tax=Pseudomonas sp. C1C7 TaxID=2735272 RepID=UPI001586BDDF|nr:DUF1120 domain-containing protein [Pseudomonas sp. C1C7]NUT76535.1 DUF1120 domain-containing protein [Pseudomonas sp. C1C7]
MNSRLPLMSAILLMAGTSSAMAASSTDLTVTGTITPAACTPSLSNGGVIDYGKVSAKDLNPTKPTFLGRVALQLKVDCDAATTFALNLADNRPNTASSLGWYGLGLINTNQKLGYFDLGYTDANTEIGPKSVLGSYDGGKTWSNYEDTGFPTGEWAAFGDRSSGAWLPAPIQNLTVNMHIGTNIAPANGLTLTNQVRMDGSATLEVKYL